MTVKLISKYYLIILTININIVKNKNIYYVYNLNNYYNTRTPYSLKKLFSKFSNTKFDYFI